MATEYIGTNDIKVFPSAFRNGDEEAKRTTEENLVKFNRLSSFSRNLEQMFEDPDDSNYVIFNIHGYWFRCLKTSIPLGNNLFAYIKLEKVEGIGWRLSAIPEHESALDLDDDGDDEYDKFTGLGFDTDVPEDELTVKYYGLKVKDENGEIVEQKLKLDSTEIRNGDSTKSISEEFTVGNLTAESVQTGKINDVSIKSVGLDVEITGPSNEIILFPSYKYGEVAFMGDIPEAIKNPHPLTIKRNNTTVGTYDGGSAEEINITDENTTYSKMSSAEGESGISSTPRTIDAATLKSLIQYHSTDKQWTHLGTTSHGEGAIRYYTEDIIEYMVIYTNLSTGKYSDMTEVVYGPGSLIHGMTLPGYVDSGIIVTSSYIEINWNSGGGVGAKSNVIVYAR